MKSPSLIPETMVTPCIPYIKTPFDGINKPDIVLKASISDYIYHMRNNRVCISRVQSVIIEIGVNHGGILIKYFVNGSDKYLVAQDFELTRQALLDTL